jgi:hypothetical protein
MGKQLLLYSRNSLLFPLGRWLGLAGALQHFRGGI